MRQLLLPLFTPIFPAPERAVLTLLNAALILTEQSLHDAHPQLDGCPDLQHNAPIVLAVAHLIAGRCTELRTLLERYDAAVDDIMHADDAIPFDALAAKSEQSARARCASQATEYCDHVPRLSRRQQRAYTCCS